MDSENNHVSEGFKKLDSMLASQRYLDIMESCKNFNRVILNQRKGCVPFIDQHTGLAQSNCCLWKKSRERMPALSLGQVFTYPTKRWIKRRRQYLNPPVSLPPKLIPEEGPLSITTLENPSFQETDNTIEDELKENWYYDIEKEDFEYNSDNSDYDFGERYRKKKKVSTPKRSSSSRSGGSRRRTAASVDVDGDDIPKRSKSSRSRQSNQHHHHQIQQHCSAPPSLQREFDQPPRLSPPLPLVGVDAPSTHLSSPEKKRCKPSLYCDFCLGDATLNKKTGQAEEMVSCADCGRSGHPSCLQFTTNMIISVKKYRWQCIECKCCTVCGNSDNDEQLLFCDDCDRGYHMYCLKPPLVEPPEGFWSCSLCVNEFHRPQTT